MHKFSIFVFNKVVRRDEWGEMEYVYMAQNFSYFVIFLPKTIKIDGNLTKFWRKQFVQFLDTVYIYIYSGSGIKWLLQL